MKFGKIEYLNNETTLGSFIISVSFDSNNKLLSVN